MGLSQGRLLLFRDPDNRDQCCLAPDSQAMSPLVMGRRNLDQGVQMEPVACNPMFIPRDRSEVFLAPAPVVSDERRL